MNSFLRKLSWLLRRRSKEDELQDELRFHLEEEAEEREAAGLPPEEAQRAARLDLGNVTLVQEDIRAVWTWVLLEQLFQDLRYAARTIASNKTFSAVAVFSLALGVGANTAIFSLWNGVLRSRLPVHEPEKLVMLSNPDASGMWTGRWVGREDGDRAWLTYGEFEQLRDQARSFSSLMASQSYLDEWQARFEGSDSEQVHGRLVSGGFFEVLGTSAMIGRTFTASDDHTDAPYAVISYPFWLRRFAGRPDVLGKTFMLRKARLTVIGVAPKGFIGETSGQQPDLWIPLRMQTLVIPGGDRLNDTPPEKAMWLHVFGRLNPGVTLPQAEAEANVIFQAGLESFYGDRLGERRSEFLDQHIGIHAAGRGASGFRKGMSDSLTALLFSVGVLVLITSANLANLLLARGSARKSEIALRLSLGASRGRLLRQLVTESLVLAAAGGLAGIVAAYVFHGALVRMIAAWNPDFQMSFSMAPEVTFFTLAVTVAAWILFGALPAWQVTKIDVGENLKMQSRTATASAVQIRWRQGLVCFQLALSLPLLVGAGLLARTLHNLQRVDLGFPAERLLILQVDARGAGYDSDALDRLTRDLRGEFQQIPGVRSASFSGNGVFSGGNSNLEIEVEGYTRQGNNDRGSSVDAVGARYFSTLGIPILAGREILETDHSGAPRVCMINEAFSRQFFAGRNPIGLEITSREADARGSCRIVGVAANARTDNLRSEVRPRFFFPAPQSPMKADGYVFLVRTVTDNAAIISAARQAIRKMNPELSIESAQTIEQQLAPLTAQNRTTAQLVAAFGCAAIALAAIGLYGVLSYNVGRRKSEIAIRIALGAQRGGVIALLLRETMRVVLLGLILGLGITGVTAGLIRSQLYGVSPQDPVVLASAAGLLILVSLTAAYIPARKASTLDPMTTLRGE